MKINSFDAAVIKQTLYDNLCDLCNGQSLYPDRCPVECLVRTAMNAADRRAYALLDDGKFTEADARHAITGE